jgi:hypothetical protein
VTARPVVLPVDLGCCPHGTPRCALCAHGGDLPDEELLALRVEAARADLVGEEQLLVGFLGGPPPAAPLLDALAGASFSVRVRPDLLTRADLARLVDAGCVAVELDSLSLDDHALRRCGRPYSGKRSLEILAGVRAAGLEAGVVIAPGLPGTDAEILRSDVERIVGLADTARLHPVLVHAGSTLCRWYEEGLFRPLPLDDTVEVCRWLLDFLEGAGVRVVRVGMQPHECAGEVVAGPVHPSLRELVETARTLDRLRDHLDGVAPGAHIEIRCARTDESRTRGPSNQNLHALRQEFDLGGVRVVSDGALARGDLRVVDRGRR